MIGTSSEVFDFDRRAYGDHTMPLRAYIMVLSGFIAGGLALASLIASYTYSMEPNGWWILGYFALSIPGIIISAKSDNWALSLLGYVMVIVPTGAIIGPYVSRYELDSVMQVAAITIGATVGLGAAGAVYPKSVEHWGGFLLMALWVIILGDVTRIILRGMGYETVTLGLIDWAAVAVFCAYIFYDMNRAVRMDYTIDNAVDNAVSLYLDVINLFIRLLAIMGHKKD